MWANQHEITVVDRFEMLIIISHSTCNTNVFIENMHQKFIMILRGVMSGCLDLITASTQFEKLNNSMWKIIDGKEELPLNKNKPLQNQAQRLRLYAVPGGIRWQKERTETDIHP